MYLLEVLLVIKQSVCHLGSFYFLAEDYPLVWR